MKKCPYCAEEIQDAAIFCRFCKRDLPAPTSKKNDENSSSSMTTAIIIVAVLIVIFGYIAIKQQINLRTIPTPTVKPYIAPTKTKIYNPVYITNTPYRTNSQSSCTIWSDITLSEVGKTLCVYGVVRSSWFSEQQLTQYFSFSSDPEAIFFQKFMYYFEEGIDGHCIQFTGKILKSYNTPYMDISPNEGIYYCD